MAKEKYFNVQMDVLNTEKALTACHRFFGSSKNNTIFFLNAHCFNIAQKNSLYRSAINDSDLLLNDGIGIKLGSYLAGIRILENLNGTDFIPNVIQQARDNNKNIYLLGGEEGVAERAKENLEQRFPGVSIVGTRNGFFNVNNDADILHDIAERETDLLIVGMGVPRQELWLSGKKDKLKGVKLSIAGGAILDFISGNVQRAPLWMRKSGIEWIFRLLQEPKRLFYRYFVGIPVFFYNIYKIRSR